MADERTYKMLLGDIAGSGSGGLPDYSEANDGDVLTIDNGEPVWAAPGGILVITATEGTLDKTWREISDAITAKNLCLIFESYGTDDNSMLVVTAVYNDSEQYLVNTTGQPYATATENGYPVASD